MSLNSYVASALVIARSSSIFATIRFCSARGGSGTDNSVKYSAFNTSSHFGEVFGKEKSKKNPDKSGIFLNTRRRNEKREKLTSPFRYRELVGGERLELPTLSV